MRIGVLGAGMVGRVIAEDLANQHSVTSFDKNADNLSKISNPDINCITADLMDWANYPSLLSYMDMVVCAVPGFMGYKTLEAVINCRKNVVDISFSPENLLDLHELAKANHVTAIVDCGVAPGMSNLVLGKFDSEMDITHFNCMVGGLPLNPQPPFNYKAPFSPIDVIEEYARPARIKKDGKLITVEALSGIQTEELPSVGKLESFYTDGLRSILYTFPHIENMEEKTLRYPGHAALMQSLKDCGFFNDKAINMNGHAISPLKFTSALLFDSWKLEDHEPEFTVMKIEAKGSKNGKPTNAVCFLYDSRDDKGISSMSRTTGFTANAAVDVIAQKLFEKKGVFPPELIGGDAKVFNHIMQYLQQRNVQYSFSYEDA